MPYRVAEGHTIAAGRGLLRSGAIISDEAAQRLDIAGLVERGMVEVLAEAGAAKRASAKSQRPSDASGSKPKTSSAAKKPRSAARKPKETT